jgi:hypothetical protein
MIVERKRNDTRKPIRLQLTDADGAVDMTNATSARIHVYREDTRAQKINAAMTFETPRTDAWVTYQPTASDMDTAGRYLMEVEVVFSDATELSFPDNGFDVLLVHDDLS